MEKVIQVAKISLTVLLFTALPFAVFILITSKTEVLGGLRSFTVLSGSMQPTIPVGSIIFVRRQPTYAFDDVVAFKNKADQTVTHRIFQTTIKDGEISYRTKGDANSNVDSEVINSKDIVGKQLFFVPWIGRFSETLKNPYGFIGFVVTPTIIFIGLELLNIKREMEKQIEEKLLAQIGLV